ncbi:MAG TPA: hypothetical protein VIM85_10205 [Pseudomonadales bacterium]
MKVDNSNFFKQVPFFLSGGFLVLVLSMSNFAGADSGSEKLLYRYKNENGVVVLDSHIPKKYLAKGYSVIDIYGNVIEKVAPALSEAEKEKLASDEKAALELEHKKKLRAEADKKLLKTFADPEDAERARDRQLETLDIQINITRGNIKRLEADIALENEKAANMERSGQNVSKEILQHIANIEKQIAKANQSILSKEQEKKELAQAFEVNIQRLKELKLHAHEN